MASGYRDKEHAFITIERDIKSGSIPGVVLLCGCEEYLIRWYTDALIKKYTTEVSRALDVVMLEGENATVDRIEESLETVSIMSERKIVVLSDFIPVAGGSVKGFTETDVKKFIGYLGEIPEGSMLIITAVEEERPKKEK